MLMLQAVCQPRALPAVVSARELCLHCRGLNGRLGAALLADPVLSRDYELVGFNRRPMESVESVQGDICDLASVEAALTGADGA